jgi:outer membrane protein assembly factor BamB
VRAPAEVAGETGPVPSLRANATLVAKLNAARHYVQRQSWAEAVPLLQALLDLPDDALVAVPRTGTDGRAATAWTGIRGEAARLLGSLPPRGREFYESAHGTAARLLLGEARRRQSLDRMAEVARRYPHTAAGTEASGLLGAYYLDRGRPLLAALWLGPLLDRPDAESLPPRTLYCAALALRRCGQQARAEQAFRRLAAAARGGLRLGGRVVSVPQLREEMDRLEAPGPAAPTPGPEGAGSLQPRWTRPTVHEPRTRAWLQAALQQQQGHSRPALPAFVPLLAGDRVVYRSHRGVHAVDVRSGREAWEAPSAWSTDRMVAGDRLLSDPNYVSHLESWVEAYLEVSPHVLYANAPLAALSTDGPRVYAVEDLAVPPYRTFVRARRRWQEPTWPDFVGPALTEAMHSSRLLALDTASGKPAWEVGGAGPDKGSLGDSYFLGPPLPLEGRLYVLTEKNNQLDLACLNADGGALLWKQPLAYAPTPMLLDPGRRLQAARAVYAEGILVCPTNAGLVLGVDAVTGGLAWAHPYATQALTEALPSLDRRRREVRTRVRTAWEAPITVAAQGRVVCTAPDSSSVRCLSLREGVLLWEAARAENDVYVAGVFAGKVLVVGKRACRALDLANGRQLWQVETGEPAGRGAASGPVYYLPLKDAGPDRAPAVWALDVSRGVVVGRTPAPAKEVLGNLLLGQGCVFSQTATAVTAYPARKDGAP